LKPLIGITTSVNVLDYETQDQETIMIPTNYPKAIRESGGISILLTESDDADEILNHLDGLVIAGGRDIDPNLYGEAFHNRTNDVRPKQDIWEIALIKGAIKRDLPLLCICRGHQLLCAIHGGKLHQHLPETKGFEDHGATGGEWSSHIINLEINSQIGSILGNQIIGNSGHHQGVYEPGNLTVVGRTEDGLIEAVELESQTFLISTQWHPEMINQRTIFDALIEAGRS